MKSRTEGETFRIIIFTGNTKIEATPVYMIIELFNVTLLYTNSV